jgi:hypothetical protein
MDALYLGLFLLKFISSFSDRHHLGVVNTPKFDSEALWRLHTLQFDCSCTRPHLPPSQLIQKKDFITSIIQVSQEVTWSIQILTRCQKMWNESNLTTYIIISPPKAVFSPNSFAIICAQLTWSSWLVALPKSIMYQPQIADLHSRAIWTDHMNTVSLLFSCVFQLAC